ncbi:valine--tRNA ligase [Candidatus Woesearchaeota archaeon]|nr:valine--tRNA ligase [Candidatus Woesearchaeota archaeon]
MTKKATAAKQVGARTHCIPPMPSMTPGKLAEKAWTKEMEQQIYDSWKQNKIYSFDPKTKKKIYSIDTPPPYVNTPIHIGHATTYSLMDMFARYKRMMGYEVLFPLGLDRNGLPIEMAAEKKSGKKFTMYSREEFLELCKKVLEESSAETTDSFLRLGISFNSFEQGSGVGDVYLTDSPFYRALTQATFINMWKKGLIYEAERTNNYCPGCRTTIADSEIDYKDENSLFTDVTWKIAGSSETIVIGTTRPEFLCSCEMVIYNPEDARYKHLEGKHAIVPLYGKEVPIKAHPFAQMDKGTGLVMMCAFGDYTDIRFFRDEKLTPRISIGLDGRMNDHAGAYKGLKVKEARAKVLEDLKTAGLIVAQRQITHHTPICERSKDTIEFIGMSEFYVKQMDHKDRMRELAQKLKWYAPESKQILMDWIDSVSIDWPISRRRYYATEVPLWHCKKCREPVLPSPGKYYQPWREKCPIATCPTCSGRDFEGETRVFDTWFDSSISPLYILKWGSDTAFFTKAKPCTLRPQGKEIIRTWLYYTLLKCYHLTGECIFSDTWINYHVLDEKGVKMSKSLGNVIDPHVILEKYGAEPFRLWCAVEGNITTTDLRCSFERIEGAGKTIHKLWNVAKFVAAFPEVKGKVELLETDKWIITELDTIIHAARDGYERYDFHNPSLLLRNFLWETFASHYLELVKARAYNTEGKFRLAEQNGALHTLNYALDVILRLWSPVMPMLTSRIYTELRGKDIHSEKMVEVHGKHTTTLVGSEIAELNSTIWKAKKDKGLSLKATIKELSLPEKFKTIEKDLTAAHGVEKIEWTKEFGIKIA